MNGQQAMEEGMTESVGRHAFVKNSDGKWQFARKWMERIAGHGWRIGDVSLESNHGEVNDESERDLRARLPSYIRRIHVLTH